MPNRLSVGDAGSTQFLDLDCKREPEEFLDLWAKNLELFFILGKGSNYTSDEKYLIATSTFTGKVDNWFRRISKEVEKVLKIEAIKHFIKSTRAGIDHIVRYVGVEFLGSQGDIYKGKEKQRLLAAKWLEKLLICKIKYI